MGDVAVILNYMNKLPSDEWHNSIYNSNSLMTTINVGSGHRSMTSKSLMPTASSCIDKNLRESHSFYGGFGWR